MLKNFHKAGKTLAVVLSVLMIAVLGLVSCNGAAIDEATAKADEALNAANAALTEEEVEALLNELLGDNYASAEDVDAITDKLADFITSADLNDYAKASVVTSIQNQLNNLTTAGNTNKTDIATIKTQLAALQTAMNDLTGGTEGNALTEAKKTAMDALDDAKAALETKYPTAVDADIRAAIEAYNDVDVLCAVSVTELNAITEAVSVYKNHTSLVDAVKAANELIDAVGSESAIGATATVKVATNAAGKFDKATVAVEKANGDAATDMTGLYINAIVGTPKEVGSGKHIQYTFAEKAVALKDIKSVQIFAKVAADLTAVSYNGVKDTIGNSAVLYNGEWYVLVTDANKADYGLNTTYTVLDAEGAAYAYNLVTVNSKDALDAASAAVAAIKADYTIAAGDLDALNTTALDNALKAYNEALLNADKAVYTAATAISNFVNKFDSKASRLDGEDVAKALGLTVTIKHDVAKNTASTAITVDKNAAGCVVKEYYKVVTELAKVADSSAVAGIEDFNEYVAALEDNLTDAVVYAVENALEAKAEALALAANTTDPEYKAARNVVADFVAEIEAATVAADTFAADCDAIEAVATECVLAVIDCVYYEMYFEDRVETILAILADEDDKDSYLSTMTETFQNMINALLVADSTNCEAYDDQDLKVIDKKGQYDYEGKNDATEPDDFVMFFPWEKKFDPETAVAGLDETQTEYYNTVVTLYNDVMAIINDAVDFVEAYEVTGTYRAATNELKKIVDYSNPGYVDCVAFGAQDAFELAMVLGLADTKATNNVTQTVLTAISNKFLSYTGDLAIVVPNETVTLTENAEGTGLAAVTGLKVTRIGVDHYLTDEDMFDDEYAPEFIDDLYAEGADFTVKGAHTVVVPSAYATVIDSWSVILSDTMLPAEGDTSKYVDAYASTTADNVILLSEVKITEEVNEAVAEYIENDMAALFASTAAAVTADADVVTLMGDFYYKATVGAINHCDFLVVSDILAAYKTTVLDVLSAYLEEYEAGSRATEGEKAFYDLLSAKVEGLIAEVEAIEITSAAEYGNAISKIAGYVEGFEFNTLEPAKKNLMADLKNYEKWTLEATIGLENLKDHVADLVEELKDSQEDDLDTLADTLKGMDLSLRNILLNSAYAEGIDALNAVTIVNGYGIDISKVEAPKFVTYEAAKKYVDETLYATINNDTDSIVAGKAGYTGTADDLKVPFDAMIEDFSDYYKATYTTSGANAADKVVNSKLDAFYKVTDGVKSGSLQNLYTKYTNTDTTFVDAMTISSFKAWQAAIKEIKAAFDADDEAAMNALVADIYAEYAAFVSYKAVLEAKAAGAANDVADYVALELAKFTFTYTDDVKNTYTDKAAFTSAYNAKVTTTIDGVMVTYNKEANKTNIDASTVLGNLSNVVSAIEWTDGTYTTYAVKDGKIGTGTTTTKAWYNTFVEIYRNIGSVAGLN